MTVVGGLAGLSMRLETYRNGIRCYSKVCRVPVVVGSSHSVPWALLVSHASNMLHTLPVKPVKYIRTVVAPNDNVFTVISH